MQRIINGCFPTLEGFLEQFPLTEHQQASLLWKALPEGTIAIETGTRCPGKGILNLTIVVFYKKLHGQTLCDASKVIFNGPVNPEVSTPVNLLRLLTEKILYWQNSL